MKNEIIQSVLMKLLYGAQLDCIRIYKIFLEIGFNQIGKKELPTTIWFATNNSLYVNTDIASIDRVADYYEKRATVIKDLFYLIGEEVSSVTVSEKGELSIVIGDKTLFLFREEEEFEEVWEIMDNSTSNFADHEWYITLLDDGDFELKYPEPGKN
ncbi:hypothetical protein [Leptospira santarosai]|uniref:hypothetical protein n=1 Tax=Leptospira santarosai TaxID=28183 RepID=UPI000977362B|nr:hypothetical protein [Leptospira santarosai]MDI7164976.1 hypothetical protein [Leptospira santarosai]ONF86896.1 hypothetical protein BWD13_09360 [Leptospira santarosai serovar Grippotyphosa]